MAEKVLIVEDQTTLLETLEYNLRHQGYEVSKASDGVAALEVARREHPDMVILDIMLPRMDGLEVCRILRGETHVPILMLTARADEVDKVVGLELGADDYLTKPFQMRELLARVKALLRRARFAREDVAADAGKSVELLESGDLQINLRRGEALRQGQVMHLQPKEFELLAFLLRHRGLVLSREQILEQVWGWTFSGQSRTVDVHVRWLREKIEADPSRPVRLVTVRGLGYRFEE